MPRPRLTHPQRLEIARERQRGTGAAVLAERFGVSRQTIHAVARQAHGEPGAGPILRFLTVRAPAADLDRFSAAAARHGLTRAEAIRRLLRAVDDVFVADPPEAARLHALGVALHRVGTNVNQIAKACNEARLRGQALPYSAADHDEVREALALAFEVADQVRHLAEGRRRTIGAAVSQAFQGGADDPA